MVAGSSASKEFIAFILELGLLHVKWTVGQLPCECEQHRNTSNSSSFREFIT